MSELQEWSKRYLDARAKYDELSEQVKLARADMDDCERELIAALNTAGIESFKTDDGVGFTRRSATKYSACAEARPELLDQLEADGYRDALTVSPGTLNRLMAEMAENNDGELPEAYQGLINIYDETKLSVRGRKGGK